MVFGQEIYNLFPNEFYEGVHVVELLLGLYFAYKANSMGAPKAALAFFLYGLTGLLHLFSHLGITTLPFSHLVSRVLLLVAVILMAKAWKKQM